MDIELEVMKNSSIEQLHDNQSNTISPSSNPETSSNDNHNKKKIDEIEQSR